MSPISVDGHHSAEIEAVARGFDNAAADLEDAVGALHNAHAGKSNCGCCLAKQRCILADVHRLSIAFGVLTGAFPSYRSPSGTLRRASPPAPHLYRTVS